MDIFSSRELALIICSSTFLLISSFSQKVRSSLLQVIKAAFPRNLTIIYILSSGYTFIGVYIIYKIGLWDNNLIKDVLIWLLFSAPISLYVVCKDSKIKSHLKESIIDNFKISAVIEFLSDKYTFNVFIEICIIIIVLFLSIMIAFTQNKEEHKYVKTTLSFILNSISIIIFLCTVYQFIVHISTFDSFGNFKEFSLPIFLAFWFIPFLYALHLYVSYETIFIQIEHALNRDYQLVSFAKKKAIMSFGINIVSAKRWANSLFINSITDEYKIIASIKELKRRERIEKNPIILPLEFGWSPYKAKDFLSTSGLSTGYYDTHYGDDWFACSPYLKLDGGLIENNIAYYISGDNFVVKSLKLVLNINSIDHQHEALIKFYNTSELLYKAAQGEELPLSIKKAIMNASPKVATSTSTNIFLSCQKQDYLIKERGYSLTFSILRTD